MLSKRQKGDSSDRIVFLILEHDAYTQRLHMYIVQILNFANYKFVTVTKMCRNNCANSKIAPIKNEQAFTGHMHIHTYKIA